MATRSGGGDHAITAPIVTQRAHQRPEAGHPRLRLRISTAMMRPSATPRAGLAVAAVATSPCIRWAARCGGFPPRSTISRLRAPHALTFSAVSWNFNRSRPGYLAGAAIAESGMKKSDPLVFWPASSRGSPLSWPPNALGRPDMLRKARVAFLNSPPKAIRCQLIK